MKMSEKKPIQKHPTERDVACLPQKARNSNNHQTHSNSSRSIMKNSDERQQPPSNSRTSCSTATATAVATTSFTVSNRNNTPTATSKAQNNVDYNAAVADGVVLNAPRAGAGGSLHGTPADDDHENTPGKKIRQNAEAEAPPEERNNCVAPYSINPRHHQHDSSSFKIGRAAGTGGEDNIISSTSKGGRRSILRTSSSRNDESTRSTSSSASSGKLVMPSPRLASAALNLLEVGMQQESFIEAAPNNSRRKYSRHLQEQHDHHVTSLVSSTAANEAPLGASRSTATPTSSTSRNQGSQKEDAVTEKGNSSILGRRSTAISNKKSNKKTTVNKKQHPDQFDPSPPAHQGKEQEEDTINKVDEERKRKAARIASAEDEEEERKKDSPPPASPSLLAASCLSSPSSTDNRNEEECDALLLADPPQKKKRSSKSKIANPKAVHSLANDPVISAYNDLNMAWGGKIITTALKNDVISGRGNHANQHPGNIKFRSIVASLKRTYVLSSVLLKKEVAKNVLEQILSLNPPGRFLREIKGTKTWEILDGESVIKKISQALREKAPELKRKYLEEGDGADYYLQFELEGRFGHDGDMISSLEEELERREPHLIRGLPRSSASPSSPPRFTSLPTSTTKRRIDMSVRDSSPQPLSQEQQQEEGMNPTTSQEANSSMLLRNHGEYSTIPSGAVANHDSSSATTSTSNTILVADGHNNNVNDNTTSLMMALETAHSRRFLPDTNRLGGINGSSLLATQHNNQYLVHPRHPAHSSPIQTLLLAHQQPSARLVGDIDHTNEAGMNNMATASGAHMLTYLPIHSIFPAPISQTAGVDMNNNGVGDQNRHRQQQQILFSTSQPSPGMMSLSPLVYTPEGSISRLLNQSDQMLFRPRSHQQVYASSLSNQLQQQQDKKEDEDHDTTNPRLRLSGAPNNEIETRIEKGDSKQSSPVHIKQVLGSSKLRKNQRTEAAVTNQATSLFSAEEKRMVFFNFKYMTIHVAPEEIITRPPVGGTKGASKYIFNYTEKDILINSNNEIRDHSGNFALAELMYCVQSQYVSAVSTASRLEITKKIVDFTKRRGGRYLVFDYTTTRNTIGQLRRWSVMPDDKTYLMVLSLFEQICDHVLHPIVASDVLFGGDLAIRYGPGNLMFKTKVKIYKDQYRRAAPDLRIQIASEIFNSVDSQLGRFLVYIENTGMWRPLPFEKALQFIQSEFLELPHEEED